MDDESDCRTCSDQLSVLPFVSALNWEKSKMETRNNSTPVRALGVCECPTRNFTLKVQSNNTMVINPTYLARQTRTCTYFQWGP